MLKGKRIGILAGPDYEDLELHYPHIRLMEEGAEVKVLAPDRKTVKGKRGLSVKPDLTAKESRAEDFDGLIIPGGWSPDRLRRHKEVLKLVKTAHRQGKILAAICHGAQVLISAKLLQGRHITCFAAIKDDVVNAGARYSDTPVVRDGNLITSRSPADLPYFCREIISALSSKPSRKT